VRKSIARVLTVTNQKARQNLREYYKKKKYLPLDLRPKKTRAIRRRLTKVSFHLLQSTLCYIYLLAREVSQDTQATEEGNSFPQEEVCYQGMSSPRLIIWDGSLSTFTVHVFPCLTPCLIYRTMQLVKYLKRLAPRNPKRCILPPPIFRSASVIVVLRKWFTLEREPVSSYNTK
jgi:hypothetical protein